MAERSFTCPRCNQTSDDPNDAEQGYCGACQGWTRQTTPYTYRKLPSHETENEWAARVRQGDKEAFASLFRTYYNRLCVYIHSYVGSRWDAEDLVEEIFTYIWLNRERGNYIAAVRAYLYRAARNRALKYIRDDRKWGKKREERDDDGEDEEEDGEIVWREYSPVMSASSYIRTDQQVITSELLGIVRDAVAALPNRRREAFLLQRQHGLSHAEIAETMGISVSTVEKHVLAAARTLRDYVGKRYGMPGEYKGSVKQATFDVEGLEWHG